MFLVRIKIVFHLYIHDSFLECLYREKYITNTHNLELKTTIMYNDNDDDICQIIHLDQIQCLQKYQSMNILEVPYGTRQRDSMNSVYLVPTQTQVQQ